MWEKLPRNVVRNIIEMLLKDCNKLKAIRYLSRNVLNIIQSEYIKHGEKIDCSFTIYTKNATNTAEVKCKLRFNCLSVSEIQHKPSNMAEIEYHTIEYVIGIFTNENKNKAIILLDKLITRLFDLAISYNFEKPTCFMNNVLNGDVHFLKLAHCNELYNLDIVCQ